MTQPITTQPITMQRNSKSPTRKSRFARLAIAAVATVFVVSACGGSDGDSGDDSSESGGIGEDGSSVIDQADDLAGDIDDQTADLEEFAEQMLDATGAGGGGVLVVDGQEIPVGAVTCQLGDDTFDVGTVSDDGWRVFVTRGNPLNDIGTQVLDPDVVQWFPLEVQGDEAVRDGGTFTSGPYTYFNNQNDTTVEISFTVSCP